MFMLVQTRLKLWIYSSYIDLRSIHVTASQPTNQLGSDRTAPGTKHTFISPYVRSLRSFVCVLERTWVFLKYEFVIKSHIRIKYANFKAFFFSTQQGKVTVQVVYCSTLAVAHKNNKIWKFIWNGLNLYRKLKLLLIRYSGGDPAMTMTLGLVLMV